MSEAVIITAIICVTVAFLGWCGTRKPRPLTHKELSQIAAMIRNGNKPTDDTGGADK